MSIRNSKFGKDMAKLYGDTKAALGHGESKLKDAMATGKAKRNDKLAQANSKLDGLQLRKALGIDEHEYRRVMDGGKNYVAVDLKNAERLYTRARDAMGPGANKLLPTAEALRDQYITMAAHAVDGVSAEAMRQHATKAFFNDVKNSALQGERRALVLGLGESLLGRLAYDHAARHVVDSPNVSASELSRQQRARKNSVTKYVDRKIERVKVNLETAAQKVNQFGAKTQYEAHKATTKVHRKLAKGAAATAVGVAATATVTTAVPAVAIAATGTRLGQGVAKAVTTASQHVGSTLANDAQNLADFFRENPRNRRR